MKQIYSFVVILALIGSAKAADRVELLYAPCASCHGAVAQGKVELLAPRLAGQNTAYLAEQLKNFKSGARGAHPKDIHGQVMAANARYLNDGEINRLAEYLNRLEGGQVASGFTGDIKRGHKLYADHCLVCHGERAEGYTTLNAPKLRILGGWYIKRQLNAYRKGWRGDGARGSARAKGMRAIAMQLSNEAELDAVVAYVLSLEGVE
ncbi:MAG: cytochrome c [Cellvibrionaceae bacterium]|nr:cytochrome c [Cellvibrionaceae bacterium]